MIPLENVFKTSLQDVLKISWRRIQNVLKTSWSYLEEVFARRLEDVLKTSLQDVLKISWRRIQNVLKRSWRYLEEVFARRLEDVWPRRIYWSWPRRLEDVLKMSSEDVWLWRIYSSWSRRLEDEDERRLQDIFIKTNVCFATPQKSPPSQNPLLRAGSATRDPHPQTSDKLLLHLIEGIIVVSTCYHRYFLLSQPLRLVFFEAPESFAKIQRFRLANFGGVGSPPPNFPDKFLFHTSSIIIRKYWSWQRNRRKYT